MDLIEKQVDVHAKTVFDGATLVALQEQQAPARDDTLRLSAAQERIWFLEQMQPGNPVNLLLHIFRLSGKLHHETLQTALDELVRRQQTLRTTFAAAAIYAAVDGRPVPIIAEPSPGALRIVDLRHLSGGESESEVANLTKLEARRRFDLSSGPLYQTTLLRLSDDEHLLLLSVHRIIADEPSCGIFIQELFAFYDSFSNNSPLDIEPLPIQYATVAGRQQTWRQTESAQEQINEWKELLRDAPGVLEIPGDRPRPPKRSYAGARESIDLPVRLAAELRELSKRAGSNFSVLLLTAFQTLLARYTSRTEIILGVPVSGRSSETKSLIGPLANSIVIRTRVVREGTFLEQLERTSESLSRALSLQEVPFEQLVEELDPQRSLSHTPIFQVMFTADHPRPLRYDIQNLRIREIDRSPEVCEFDLSLSVRSDEETARVFIDYNTELFAAGTVQRLLENFMCLLEGVAANPEQRLSTTELINPQERQQLAAWNETEQWYEREAGIHELIERQAERQPHGVAVVFGEQQLSYAELNGRANQLAAYLRRQLVPESLVGIYLERSPEMLIAVLGVLKAGAAYVPLAIEHPEARLAYMIADAGLALIITEQHLKERLPASEVPVVGLEAAAEAIATESAANVRGHANGQSLAYVIYTSGSTGQPKAVEISHAAVVNFLTAMERRPGLGASDRLLAVTTLSFDIAGLELYLPLTVGGCVELVTGAEAADGNYLKEKLGEGRITALQATPATWRMLLESGWRGTSGLKILCGGEALPRELANELLGRGESVWNMYGPTETTIWSAVGELAGREGPVLLGEPIANTQLYVLDEALQLAPVGVAGELFIGGEGLARGYHGRPALTAERFLPDPYARAGGARMYRTGDLVRRLSDGRFEFLGRLDHQVKIRGFRIELGEIKHALSQHESIHDNIVTAAPEGSSGGQRLIAYLVARDEANLDIGTIRKFLKSKLPDYMTPSVFITLPALPLMPNGKVDMKALPAPDESRPRLEAALEKPQDPIEAQLVTIWQTVLGVVPVGVTENFFDLGGHSLLAVRVFAQIENRFGKALPLATLFQAPTIRDLAAVLRDEGCRRWSSLVPIRPTGSKLPLFCIHAAGANVLIYRPLAHHLDPEQPVYALQALGLDGITKPLTRVEEMASHYLNEIRTVQPKGPYHLTGASFGGLVAFEMAQRLQAQGEQVALLALLDTDCPVRSLALRARSHWAHLRERGPATYMADALNALRKRFRGAFTGGAAKSEAVAEAATILPGKTEFQDPLVRTVETNLQAGNTYVPRNKIYPGRITFFYAEDSGGTPAYDDNRLEWGKLATEGFEIHRIPGTHITMREEPNVAVLARVITECLEKAQHSSANTTRNDSQRFA